MADNTAKASQAAVANEKLVIAQGTRVNINPNPGVSRAVEIAAAREKAGYEIAGPQDRDRLSCMT
ncbi:MAG: hypothetical protein ACOYNL_10365, partial [Rickettsiales bacterium]